MASPGEARGLQGRAAMSVGFSRQPEAHRLDILCYFKKLPLDLVSQCFLKYDSWTTSKIITLEFSKCKILDHIPN